MLKIGSLCTGYGGLDLAVEQHFNADTVWCAEFDKYASQVVNAHFDIPNYGDIKAINWAEVEPIDILTAGYPCQPFSHAGYRKGTDDDRHIFPYILEAISILRPRWVILENVRGHLSLGLKEVLQGLAEQGYDARWQVIRASDVGAPHQRARLFIIAYPNGEHRGVSFQTKEITNSDGNAREKSRRAFRGISCARETIIDGTDREIDGGSDTDASYTDYEYKSHDGKMQRLGRRFTARRDMHLQAIPNALDQSGKLNAAFVEYMMGLPPGWVTSVNLSRAQQLKILGNGVVPQQAEYALELLTADWDINE
jgi:DNA (cytosine-5)-methyltransferase 1